MTHDFSSRDLRDALGLFPTGIAVATTTDGAERIGITINSFSSVSMAPPLVLFSAAKSLHSYQSFANSGGFTINLLARDQKDLSARFARAGEEKWRELDAVPGQHGGVILRSCLAVFDCKMYQCYDGGDHGIFVGEVVGLRTSGDDPLIYFRSNYHEIGSGIKDLQAA